MDKKYRKLVIVAEEELTEWKNLFNDHHRWGIRKELENSEGVMRGTLNRTLLTGRAYESTVQKIRKFISSYKVPA